MHKPDNWVLIKLPESVAKNAYKVLGGWSGGYLDGDSWRLNSGIVKVIEKENHYEFIGYSGSEYHCIKGAYRVSMASAGIAEQAESQGCKVLTEEEMKQYILEKGDD